MSALLALDTIFGCPKSYWYVTYQFGGSANHLFSMLCFCRISWQALQPLTLCYLFCAGRKTLLHRQRQMGSNVGLEVNCITLRLPLQPLGNMDIAYKNIHATLERLCTPLCTYCSISGISWRIDDLHALFFQHKTNSNRYEILNFVNSKNYKKYSCNFRKILYPIVYILLELAGG